MIRGKFFKKMSGGGNSKYVPPALNAQTAYFGFDGSVNGSPNITGTFARTGVAYDPNTGASTATGVPRYVIGKAGQALFVEEATTNVFTDASPPVNRTISLTTANGGKWTCSVKGNGTVTSSAGTATATGYGVASQGSPNVVTVTGNGTVTYTVSGVNANTLVQVENKAYPTSWQSSAGARNAETFAFTPTGILTASTGAISMWVYVGGYWSSASSGFYRVFFDHITSTAVANNIGLGKTDIANQWYFQTGTTGASPSFTTVAVTKTLATGWHHFVGVWGDGGNPKLYIDGALEGTGASNNLPSTIHTTCNIGSTSSVRTGGAALHSNTSIDAVRIYNRALAAAEIKQLYTFGR